ncbi:MAG: diacylglycerol kinase family protein [Terriglobia bacterium]
MPHQPRIVAVLNPSSGHGEGRRLLPRIEASFARWFGNRARVIVTTSADHIRALARTAAQEGTEIFAVCGGDGTAHYALQELVHTKTALGIVPIGSGNDLAVNLNLPREPEDSIEMLLSGITRNIDVGQTRTAFYSCIAGVGLDSEVNRRANVRRWWVRGRAIYPFSILQTLISFRPRHVRICCDDQVFEGAIMFAVVANASSYGRGIRIAPMATMDDGALDVCIVKAMPKMELLRVYPKTYRGTHIDHPGLVKLRGRDIQIESDQPLELFGDGEYLEPTPTRIQLLPLALRVVVPR